jgi:DNA-binding transcriptional regulator/RsmH inhibitor MraZ
MFTYIVCLTRTIFRCTLHIMKRVNIVAEESQIEVWKDSAWRSKLNLSQWIRQTLDAEAARAQMPATTAVSEASFDQIYGAK